MMLLCEYSESIFNGVIRGSHTVVGTIIHIFVDEMEIVCVDTKLQKRILLT